MSKDMGNRSDDSEVFLVRLWAGGSLPHQESGGTEDREDRVRGKVTHLLSGKASSFSDGDTLVSLLVDMLPATHNDHDTQEEKGV